MEFDWDEANIRHIARHNLYPEDVEAAFDDSYACDIQVHRGPQKQRRYALIGQASHQLIVVIYERQEINIRVVTARKATRKEQRLYEQTRF